MTFAQKTSSLKLRSRRRAPVELPQGALSPGSAIAAPLSRLAAPVAPALFGHEALAVTVVKKRATASSPDASSVAKAFAGGTRRRTHTHLGDQASISPPHLSQRAHNTLKPAGITRAIEIVDVPDTGLPAIRGASSEVTREIAALRELLVAPSTGARVRPFVSTLSRPQTYSVAQPSSRRSPPRPWKTFASRTSPPSPPSQRHS